MNVKDAIAKAKDYIREVYADENVSNLGLEETLFDDSYDRWLITVGFSRPWNTPRTSAAALLEQIGGSPVNRKRVYKVVTIGRDGEVVAMKNREIADTDG